LRKRYNREQVTHLDILPTTIEKNVATDWLFDRTLMRPRDVIAFFNEAIRQAVDSPEITANMLKLAEGFYSRGRLKSLADEWFADYPNLLGFVDLLKNRRCLFPIEELDERSCEDFCIGVVSNGFGQQDYLSLLASQVVDCVVSAADFRKNIIEVMYRVGLVGLKLEAFESVVWAVEGRRSVSTAEIHPGAKVAVHPCFWRTLGIRPA
jgi:hypothetical protein